MSGWWSDIEWNVQTRLRFGMEMADRLGETARELHMTRVLIVSDPGVVKAGHVQRVIAGLGHDIHAQVFDQVRENPTTLDVDRGLASARAAQIDGLIAVGGGSSIDTAKGINFLLTNGGKMRDYWGFGKASKPMLPLIAVPTTAGTGSEVQSYALIAEEASHQKMACGDLKAAPRVAILDPELTLTQPARVTACTGLDALAHAIESAVSTRANLFSQMLSRNAFTHMYRAFPEVLAKPRELGGRGLMQMGAALAGMAIEASMLGAAHSAANPLTAHFNITHGHAVALMLPHVVRFNVRDAEPPSGARNGYVELVKDTPLAQLPPSEIPAALADWYAQQLQASGLTTTLQAAGVPTALLPQLAAEAMQQWTAQFNPRPLNADNFRQLYEAAWS